ncbi:class I SAM-dependent methyltransferase [Pontiella agarivorans]|uniref:Class I SAM-dependent methyltransferase n=1 Tax=Pontiella agarivorans TaxID=3038953 RepID=A0ABU5MWU6_9BACT|nr:class I SAM-dependent methyltransferase [Pontiella agarivorans]MDZ8118668.1 class I SAM-dependent methyltransferase [Pontiella agarivorans]
MNDLRKNQFSCPLCENPDGERYYEDGARLYVRCGQCALIFVPESFWLSAAEEKAEYDRHENGVDDPGYRKFLSRLVIPMLGKLAPGQHGLDFGCGPGPALSMMMQEAGHRMTVYDPFYADSPEVLEATYDFICTTEVVEHLCDPRREFTTLFSCLKPGGWLGIMTKLTRDDRNAFANWHYIRDRTHICFYHRTTFEYLAMSFGVSVRFMGPDVILMQKPV